MAINTQKFLPSSKGGAIAKINTKIIRSSSPISLSEKSIKDIGIIRVNVIQIDDLLKGTLASEKKKLNDAKKQESSKRREKIEEKLETKPKVESGKVKMPSLPRMGFLDWVKNFIGNVILGYFAVRLVDHLPKIIPIVKFLGQATDLVLGFGGKLLDGLVTFIDWGYKAVDFSRGLVGNAFGDEALKNFDKLTSEFEKFMNLAIIVGMASADFGMSRFGRKGTERAAEKGAGTLARRGAGRAAARVGGKGAAKLTTKVGSKALKAIPFLGAGLAITEGIMRIRGGDYVGGLLSFGSAVPVAGWAFLALDIAREFMGGKEFDKSVGRAFGGKPGLTDKQVQKRTPYFSGPDPIVGVAGGGMPRGGRPKRGVKRTVSKKSRYRRRLSPQKPGEVQATSPGADVGGEKKLFGIFPNPFKKVVDTYNPFKNVTSAGKNLGESDYFGPIFAISSKIILGQKPSQQDYKNVGLGINMLVAKGIDDGKLKGGLVAAFAEGGFVDPKTLDAISQGGDISDWVAKSFKDATETNSQKTLREIQENLRLKKDVDEPEKQPGSAPSDGGDVETAGGAVAASQLYKEIGANAEQWDIFRNSIALIESGGKYGIPGGSGMHYDGRYQMGEDAKKDGSRVAGVSYPGHSSDPNAHVRVSFRTNPQLQETIFTGFTVANHRYLMRNPKYKSASVERKLQILGYAHNQGMGGAENWLTTGVVGADGFGTKGTKYTDLIAKNFRAKKSGGQMQLASGAVGTSVGTVNQKGLPPLPPTNTLPGKQHYGAQRRGGRRHAGVDFDAPDNGTFYSRIGGEVIYSANAGGGYGNVVDIYNKKLGVTERIAEGSANLVRIGQIVSAGTPVQRGTHQTGVFHYEVRRGKATGSGSFEGTMDPIKFLSGASKYEKGGFTKNGPHMALVGEKGREFVIDADSTKAIEETFPGFLGAINEAKYKDAINVLSNFASYESGAEQTVVIADSLMGTSSQSYDEPASSAFVYIGGDEESDPFSTLYQGG
jgi:murein DD-endopeptidase MepM/ murein hydrolase activator NlpD